MPNRYNQYSHKSLISRSTVFSLAMIVSSGILSLSPALSHAETLQIPAAPTPRSYSVTLPGRGMSMTEVLEKFGEPEIKEPEVGEPPITRWVYPDYVVVFEYQYVIHALTTNKPMGFMAPKSADTKTTEKMPKMEMDKMHKASQQEATTPHGH